MSVTLHNVSSATFSLLTKSEEGKYPVLVGDDRRRFWAKVRRTDGCWLWTASRSGGRKGRGGDYGQFTVQVGPVRRVFGAHILSFVMAHGQVPDGLEVMHTCDVGPCVKPAHLKAATHDENVKDAAHKGRLSVERPTRHKMTNEQCEQAIAWVRAGRKQVDVARHFGVSKAFISQLVKGKARKYRPSVLAARQQQKAS